MATNDPDEIKRRTREEINRLVGEEKQLYQEQYDLLERNNSSVESFKRLLRDVKNTIRELNSDLNYTFQSFKNIVAELAKAKAPLQFQETLISNSAKLARETLEIRKGETFADASRIKYLQQEAQSNIELLANLKESLEVKGESTTEITKQINGLKGVKKALDDILERDKELNKELKAGGQATSFLDKTFSKIGLPELGFKNALEKTKMMGQGAKAAGVEFNAASYYAKQIGTNLNDAFKKGGATLFLEQLLLAIKKNDEATGNLAKDFNITYDEANRVREELTTMANLSGDNALNTRRLQESMVAIGKSLGSNAKLNQQDLEFMTKLREQAGFTNEEIIGIEKTTLATGRNLKDNVKSLMFAAKTTALNNGVLLNEKDIMRDVANTSDAIKLSLKGSGGALGAAAAQAKALGLSLSQVDNIAKSLLDFEQSISAELEAELLTGKELNLEQARLYAINNDIEGLSREIAKNYGSAAEFGQMNRLQQEAAAKAVGMTRDELAKTLTDAEALRGLSGEQAKEAKKALAAARARGMTEEEIAEKGITDLMKQQSMQERFNQSVEKLQEIFVGIAEALSPILTTLTGMLEIAGYIMKPLGAIMDWASGFGPIMKTIVGLLLAAGAAALFFNGSLTLGIGVAAALAAIGVGMSYFDSKVKPMANVDDAQINPDGGLVVSGAKGTYKLNKDDSVIAGTNLNSPQETTGDNNSSNIMIAELKEIKNILNKTYNLNRATSLSNPFTAAGASADFLMDSFGTKVKTNTYKTQ